MKLDKASLYANSLRIKALEDIVIEAGANPTNIEGAKAIIKQKNEKDLTSVSGKMVHYANWERLVDQCWPFKN